MLRPVEISRRRGGANFKKAQGRGLVSLKCDAPSGPLCGPVSFRVSVGGGCKDRVGEELFCAPVTHEFAEQRVCDVPSGFNGCKEWDFAEAVGEPGSSLRICVEVLPAPLAEAVATTPVPAPPRK